ncbi:hypothetical protein F6X40_34195 [Paraburkholderia sp. UCT31]|nr:hypothetical protein [Paraburkholderia sp. 31.1]MBC8741615.1 hypothetical protein [Paraburkholderia sp. UCT31]
MHCRRSWPLATRHDGQRPTHNGHSTFSKAATVAQVSIFGLFEDALADVRAVLARTAASGE